MRQTNFFTKLSNDNRYLAMTAEIAILNKSAVALAADSAISLGTSGKIFPDNKLFALTKWHPVGVMIYNNAEYMGIP